MGSIDDVTKAAQDFIEDNKEKIGEALKSEQAEGVSDSVLDSVADLAKKVTGGKFDEHIDGARDAADGAVGNE
ncbi:antitoxin [Agromyces endophyticus]|uniref:antitoxin n=1 Tax=Agromyces sp. H17E-10 TaxID=2932244 RepID=UPI001FD0EC32|nr:antitoxin [Agromyces sp. H17E-10]UOQ87776.1 antitoxin [Agromyces sp. H17E-10]